MYQINMDFDSIKVYWQYISFENLENHLLKGVWYNHAQPPVFNLFLGGMLKLSGSHAAFIFPLVFKIITIINVIMLYQTTKILIGHSTVPLIISLIYMLSPATMILENELFYTTFITMLLLISSYCLLRFSKEQNYRFAWGFLLPLSIACLTRSMYNISWLVVVALVVIYYFRKTAFTKLVIVSLCAISLAGSWYLKNYIIFGKFTTSTWLGMNLARNVFHESSQFDPTKIESIEPFSKISTYKPFISGVLEEKYSGLNDIDLLQEYKNGNNINENHISYIEVSEKYAQASKNYIIKNPLGYAKNVLQSVIIFFVPATHYTYAIKSAKNIYLYDIAYSFNLTHFAKGKKERKIAIAISAIPKMILYGFTFIFIISSARRARNITAINLFIFLTFSFVFIVSSFLEHYENMRFRYEIEPLFLILLAQLFDVKWKKYKSKLVK